MNQRPPRVFISYAHDSEHHKSQVRKFAQFLRAGLGVDVRFDQWHEDTRQDWSAWAIRQVRRADFVLVIASAAYKDRAEGCVRTSEGRGSQFETALLRDLLTGNRTTWVRKILPVVLPGRRVDEIPAFLQPYSATRYVVDSFTIPGVDELYRVITRQPRHHPPETGRLVSLSSPRDPV